MNMDYLFYRLYLWYKNNRWFKSKIPKYSSVLYISAFIILLLFDVIIVLGFTVNFELSNFLSDEYRNIWAIGIAFVIVGLLYLRYRPKRKFDQIMNKFENHVLNKKIKNWQVPLIPVAIWVIITFCIFYFWG